MESSNPENLNYDNSVPGEFCMKKISLFLSGMFFCFVLNAFPANAASIADSLADYYATLSIEKISSIADSNISGVTLNTATGTLYTVDNGSCKIYELDTSGNLIRSITTSGFDDLEGIAYYKENYFYLAEEQRGNIVHIAIPSSGTAKLYRSNGTIFNIGSGWGNSGIEGVCFRAADSTVYAVKEKDPSRLYRLTLDSTGIPDSTYPNDPFNIENKSGDAADIFALPGGDFLIVDQEENLLVGYGPTGKILSQLDLSVMTQPEGVTVDTSNGTIYIVGEPRQFFVFKKDKTSIKQKERAALAKNISFTVKHKTENRFIECSFYIPSAMYINIDLFSASGKEIKAFNRFSPAGTNKVNISLPQVFSGVYICRIKTDLYQKSIKGMIF
jgi:uncharacterized protein YjiK